MTEATESKGWLNRLAPQDLRAAAERLKARRREAGAPAPRPLARPAGPLPLSFAQERLWFLDQLLPGTGSYNLPLALELLGRLDRAALAAALSTVVARHEVLRTTFPLVAGQAAQQIAPAGPIQPPLVDLAGLPPERRRPEALELAASESRRPFDLAQGPLLRATLLSLGGEAAAALHIALLTMHHTVADGWSLGILVRELGQAYAAHLAGARPDLPALPWQYADFSLWQRQWLAGAVLAEHLDWWRQHLAGAPAVLDLPLDHPRPAMQSFRGQRHGFLLAPELGARLGAVGRAAGATPFMVFLAGFAALLARVSGQRDVVVGSPVASRNRVETDGLIGFFVNTLVLRVRLDGGEGGAGSAGPGEQTAGSFEALIGRVRESTLGAYSHQELPFEKLVGELRPERSLSHTPLFQVMFALQNMPEPRLDLPGLTLRNLVSERQEGKFDLSLTLAEGPRCWDAGLEYDPDLFEAATVERLAHHFVTLLAGLAADPRRPLAEIDLHTADERRQILAETPAAVVAPPARLDRLDRLIAAQAARTPAGVAVLALTDPEGAGEPVTYAELEARAERLARRLRRLGVGPEVPVAVCLERSPELIVALLATWKAAGAYLPLDPANPRDRLAFFLADAGAPVVVTAPVLTPLFAGGTVHVLTVDGGRQDEPEPTEPGMGEAEPTDPRMGEPGDPPGPLLASTAYIIYTSGSTGRPKGVAVEHGPIARHELAMREVLGLAPGDRVPLLVSPGFDVSLDEIVPALLAGATLVTAPPDVWEPARFLALVARLRLTHLNPPTAYWHHWLAELEGVAPPPDLALRLVLAGGEAMGGEAARRWFATPLSGVEMWNSYGPTEALVTSSWLPLDRAGAAAAGRVFPIGRPAPGRRARVVDAEGHLTPAGVDGELLLGGLLARGYLGRPELTAERFRPDPFAAPDGGQPGGEPGARLYRTGDLVRRRADGILEFVGRVDRQVKVRGFRIELGEVEAALAACPGVREAVVLLREDRPGHPELVAYVAAPEGATRESLRGWLVSRLPGYMVPSAFVVLAALPVNANGKLDRDALPAPERRDAELEQAYVAPRDAVEQVVADVWTEVLGVEKVGIHDAFFELGGHSLLATQVVSRLANIFRVDVPLRRLFEGPTVAGLSAAIRSAERKPGQSEKVAAVLRRLRTMSDADKQALRDGA